MKTHVFFTGIIIAVSLMLAAPAQPQNSPLPGTSSPGAFLAVPRSLSYQGLLRGVDDKPIADGRHTIAVTLYGDNTGSAALWTDSYDATTEQGIFNIILGSGATPLPVGTVLNRALWVGVRLDGGEEMRPLSQLVASPYALNVADNSISASKLQDNAVTAEKMGTDYVAGIAVNGVPVTSKGSTLNLVGGDNTSLSFDKPTNSIIVSATASSLQGEGDTTSDKSWKKGGARTQQVNVGVVEGNGNGAAAQNYLTLWETNAIAMPPNPINTKISNSAILDNGTSVIINTAPGGAVAALTITEASGNMTWADVGPVVLMMNAPASGNADSITVTGAPAPSATNNNGGNVVLIGGGASGTGNAGSVHLIAGTAAANHGGNVIVEAPNGLFAVASKSLTLQGNGCVDFAGALKGPVNFQTATYNVVATDYVIVENPTVAAATVTLPAANASHTPGRILYVQRGLTATQNVVITPNGTDTVDGAATVTLTGGAGSTVATLISDGSTNWIVTSLR